MVRQLYIAVLMLAIIATPVLADDSGEWTLSTVRIIDVQSGDISDPQDLVISNGLIQGIEDAKETPTDPGRTVIDGKGAFLLPGLAEMHAHVPAHRNGEQEVQDVLMLYLANGITTIRGMLGEPWHLELRNALEQHEVNGPRLITSGPSFNGRSVSSPDQAEGMVREQKAAGYDFLKLHPGLESEEFLRIDAVADEVGISFGGHVSTAVGLQAALKAEQATIDHLDGYAQALVPKTSSLYGEPSAWFGVNLGMAMDSSLIAQWADRTAQAGVWNVPTQSLMENLAGKRSAEELLARPSMRFVGLQTRNSWADAVTQFKSEVPSEQAERFIDIRRQLIQSLQQSGAGLLLGSDAPQIMNVPGFSIHEELAFMVAAGLTPLQALQSGTVNVAEFLQEDNAGGIKTGFRADLVVLGSDPTQNIAATRDIQGVVRAGQWFSREALDEALLAIEERRN